jgi:hypothetical protein
LKNQSGPDPLNFPIKTYNRLASLLGLTLRGEGKPTANIYPILEDLKKELKAETDRLEEVLSADLAAFNAEAKRAGLEPMGANRRACARRVLSLSVGALRLGVGADVCEGFCFSW